MFFCGSPKASMAVTTATVHGVVFDILVGSEAAPGLRPSFQDERRVAGRGSTTVPATIVPFNIVASIRGTVAVER